MIFYFSGTGNTRWAAEYLAKQTGERLLFIPQEMKGTCAYNLSDNEIIGFCFPVHGWQPPKIVRQFIRTIKIRKADNNYCFALCTCGDTIGDTVNILNKDLVRHNLHTDSAFSVIMPETYVCLPFMHTDTPEREKEKISNAEKVLRNVAVILKSHQRDTQMLNKGTAPFLLSYVVGGYFNKYMITDKPFSVDHGSCIKCGRCSKVCPVGNIMMAASGIPEWKHCGECTCCLACYHHCPTHAINYGKRTRTRGQYYFKRKNIS